MKESVNNFNLLFIGAYCLYFLCRKSDVVFQSPFHRSHLVIDYILSKAMEFQSPFHRSWDKGTEWIKQHGISISFSSELLFVSKGADQVLCISISFSSELNLLLLQVLLSLSFQSPFHRSNQRFCF